MDRTDCSVRARDNLAKMPMVGTGVLDRGILELRSPCSNPAISQRVRLAPAVHSHHEHMSLRTG